MSDEKKKKPLRKLLLSRYRLVVLNNNTFEEKFALRLTPMGLLTLVGSVTILMTFLVISLVAFTPLREYIPGYGTNRDRSEILRLYTKSDSIEQRLKANEWFLSNIHKVLQGEVEGKPLKPQKDSSRDYAGINTRPSREDSALRYEIENQDKFSLAVSKQSKSSGSISSFFFFSPIKGLITSSFNLKTEHFGVDVSAKENEFVKATLAGTVVFSGWTHEDGYIIQIQHGNNLMSIYKHNSSLSKKAGDYVKAGDPIAIVGNTGETSSGTHLHFELWYNGNPINPQDYIVF